ncbi:hypothetical protein [Mucilaginibacter sp. UR6-11]|uniref:hypothetical protein n=1 Tax=Mucilaginibacter sp. UR6-11 TaxID=1435644 RepID=UPI001E3E0257|nr:hypothetical protein [Mucilaginibacter sp. UR6-11]MCC8424365.1 hypothetical protein [Mucilaginibacter sp. UR6-11]
MKQSIIIFLLFLIYGCHAPQSQKQPVEFIHPINIKIAGIQACLDTAYLDGFNGMSHIAQKLILIKRNDDTIGLGKLHLNSNQLYLDTLPKGLELGYYSFKHKVFVDIKYLPIAEDEADIKIIFYAQYIARHFRVKKAGNKLIVRKILWGMS